MKRYSSAPSLAEIQQDNRRKRIRVPRDEVEGPNTREFLQLALSRVFELQREVNDDTYFNDETSDLGESDNEDDLMRHVLTKVFRDLPGTTSTKVSEIIERGSRSRRELTKIRGKSIQLSGYDTCRKVAVDFMKKAVKTEKTYRLPDSPVKIKTTSATARRRSIGNADFVDENDRKGPNENLNYELRMRMLTSLDLHLATKQRDYTSRLMRH